MYRGAFRFNATCVGPLPVYVLTMNSYSSIHVAQTSAENQFAVCHSELPISIFCLGYPCLKNPREETRDGLNMMFLVLTIIIINFIMTTIFLACDVILP